MNLQKIYGLTNQRWWKFSKTDNNNNRYTIESLGSTGYFMQSSKVDGNKVPLTTNEGSNDYFTVSTSGTYIRFQSTSSRNNSSYYLSVNNSTVSGHNSNNNQTRRNFHLFEVTKEGGTVSITKEETIPISIIDKNTGEASLLTAIKRNDFINILVNVTYNEKKGQIEFKVGDWNEVNGDVTFD